MAAAGSLAAWITIGRIRAHAIILALCLWGLYAWNMATPGLRDRAGNLKGTDFLHFYTLGSLAVAHRGADLYNMQAQAGLAAQRVPAAAGIRYLPLYPPQVSMLFAPLARLPYGWALVLWLTVTMSIYAACAYALWRACPNLRDEGLTVLILAAAFPAFWHLIAWGQTSALALGCFTLAFFALRAERDFLAGLAFGCLIFKPQLVVAVAVVFVVTARWRLISGAILAAAAQLAAAWVYYGLEPLRTWVTTLLRTPSLLPLLEPKPYQTHSLRTFWSMLVPWPEVSLVLYVITAALALAATILCWRRSGLSLSVRFSTLLLASALVAPHLTVYDLVILGPVFLLLADWGIVHSEEASNLGILLYALYAAFLLGPLTRWTHVQLSVLVMAALLLWTWKLARRSVGVTVAIPS